MDPQGQEPGLGSICAFDHWAEDEEEGASGNVGLDKYFSMCLYVCVYIHIYIYICRLYRYIENMYLTYNLDIKNTCVCV